MIGFVGTAGAVTGRRASLASCSRRVGVVQFAKKKDDADRAADDAKNRADKAADETKKRTDDAADNLKEGVSRARDGAKDFMDEAKKRADRTADAVDDRVDPEESRFAEDLDRPRDPYEEAAANVDTDKKVTPDSYKSGVEQAASNVEGQVDEVASTVKGGAEKARQKFKEGVEDTKEKAEETMNEFQKRANRFKKKLKSRLTPDSQRKRSVDEVSDEIRDKSSDDLKQDLLVTMASTNRGFAATEGQTNRIFDIITVLESRNPTDEPVDSELLEGNWRLVYTNALDVLFLGALPLVQLGQVYQNIYSAGGYVEVENLATFEPSVAPVLNRLGKNAIK